MNTAIDLLARQSNEDAPAQARNSNPVVAFIIGFAIIIMASILNAAGLNLTKLDHVRTSSIPKSARRKDWLRPLWLLGMILYILSQLIGSTLALDYLRAEYVAPLGSTSLIFNFLFASFLVGSPVTSNDIYGTIIVIVGVIGIVAFGSINSGLASETNAERLTYLWRRSGWLWFFFLMAVSLICTYIFTNELETVLSSRSDLTAEPFAGMSTRRQRQPATSFAAKAKDQWESLMLRLRESLEAWTASHSDKQIAWTLGIGWACCGGGLAGLCLVFAKAAVKLITGSLSHENIGNQFGHVSSIFTFIFLAITAVFQIICLNRGLRVYDSTLVVPVFYGVYTAAGFVDSLIFNDSVDAYQTWTLFLIFISIVTLISGVVLLTLKKPQANDSPPPAPMDSSSTRSIRSSTVDSKSSDLDVDDEGENSVLRGRRTNTDRVVTDEMVWQVGDLSDDEDHENANASTASLKGEDSVLGNARLQSYLGEEGVGLMQEHDLDGEVDHDNEVGRLPGHRRSNSSDATLAGGSVSQIRSSEDFKDWDN